MALHVVDSGQYVESTSAPNVGPAFSVSAWYRPTTLNAGTVLGIGSSGTSQYVALGMQATGNGFLEVSGGGTADAFATGNFSDNTWHHLGGVNVSNSNRTFYADGIAGTTNTTAITPSGASRDRVTIGALRSNGSLISTAQGDIAECAIWSVDLTAAEMAALAAGFSPLLIRPAALVFYTQLIGRGDPEQDIRGGLSLPYGAGAAAPTIAAHPVVFNALADATALVPTATPDVTVNAVPATTTYSTAAPALRTDVASTPGVATYSAVALVPQVAVPGVAGAALFSAPAPGLATSVAAVGAHVTFTAAAPMATVGLDGAAPRVTYSALAPSLTAGIAGTPAVATYSMVAPATTGGALVTSAWTYGGDDDPTWTYHGDDDPTWTYGG
jgi:hypothetical protein